ncbi:MAG: thiamine phosphate synthase [Planctomycetes bacterium]|nr:thiamine phosphate synthase [Planctomycetota bacterium]
MDSALRILDANANRAREGLRVVEEYVRFSLDATAFTERLKQLRHELVATLQLLQQAAGDGVKLENFRDTAGDVGTGISTPAEMKRADATATARAGMKRLQEALRVLEEYGKIVSPEAAAGFERLRYASYDIEPLIFADGARRSHLAEARLYVLVTEALASTDALTAAREAVAGGADMIQMREKELEDSAFYKQALAMREICNSAGALFMINDRPHLAKLVNADGIHTGQGDLPVNLSRRIIGPDRLIGRSTNAPEVLQAAFEEGADYAGVGPVYATKTKEHRAAVGLEYVSYAAREAKIPYFCIGSINRETLGGVLDAGAKAVAVCTAIIGVKDIAAEAAWFKERVMERNQ